MLSLSKQGALSSFLQADPRNRVLFVIELPM